MLPLPQPVAREHPPWLDAFLSHDFASPCLRRRSHRHGQGVKRVRSAICLGCRSLLCNVDEDRRQHAAHGGGILAVRKKYKKLMVPREEIQPFYNVVLVDSCHRSDENLVLLHPDPSSKERYPNCIFCGRGIARRSACYCSIECQAKHWAEHDRADAVLRNRQPIKLFGVSIEAPPLPQTDPAADPPLLQLLPGAPITIYRSAGKPPRPRKGKISTRSKPATKSLIGKKRESAAMETPPAKRRLFQGECSNAMETMAIGDQARMENQPAGNVCVVNREHDRATITFPSAEDRGDVLAENQEKRADDIGLEKVVDNGDSSKSVGRMETPAEAPEVIQTSKAVDCSPDVQADPKAGSSSTMADDPSKSTKVPDTSKAVDYTTSKCAAKKKRGTNGVDDSIQRPPKKRKAPSGPVDDPTPAKKRRAPNAPDKIDTARRVTAIKCAATREKSQAKDASSKAVRGKPPEDISSIKAVDDTGRGNSLAAPNKVDDTGRGKSLAAPDKDISSSKADDTLKAPVEDHTPDATTIKRAPRRARSLRAPHKDISPSKAVDDTRRKSLKAPVEDHTPGKEVDDTTGIKCAAPRAKSLKAPVKATPSKMVDDARRKPLRASRVVSKSDATRGKAAPEEEETVERRSRAPRTRNPPLRFGEESQQSYYRATKPPTILKARGSHRTTTPSSCEPRANEALEALMQIAEAFELAHEQEEAEAALAARKKEASNEQ